MRLERVHNDDPKKLLHIFLDLISLCHFHIRSLSEVSGWTTNWYFIMHTNLTCETEGRRPKSEKSDLFLHVLSHQFFLYFFSFTLGPLAEVQTATGLDVTLPCDLFPNLLSSSPLTSSASSAHDKVTLVIWYKEGNQKPIYS